MRLGLTAVVMVLVGGVAGIAWGQEAPTFTKDVAPILYERCVSCHRPGEVAPMSLTTYSEARPWARSIKAKVQSREMPPWHASPRSLPMLNDRSLSQAEIDTVVAWVDSGAAEGNPADLPPAPTFREGWQHPSGRAPDVVVSMPLEYEIPADGMLEYVNFNTKWPLDEDRIVEAMEARPGNRRVVHHFSGTVSVVKEPPPAGPVLQGIDSLNIPFPSPIEEKAEARPIDGGVGVLFVPGAGFDYFAEGFGQVVPGGPDSYVSFGMHYTTTGQPERDQSMVGYWFRDAPVKRLVEGSSRATSTVLAEGREILWEPGRPAPLTYAKLPTIPPFAEHFETTMVVPFQEDTSIYSLEPHGHLRASAWDYRVIYPDGREQVVLDVPRYDFNWQIVYQLKEPLQVPAGSTMIVTAVFDNSEKNRYNPAPQNEVVWADQSWEEMFVPFIDFLVDVEDAASETEE